MLNKIKTNMVQYAVWSNCNNNCDFCLRHDRRFLTKTQQIEKIDAIIDNINYVDWKNKFSGGISLLGGELYSITDVELQNKFLELIDVIIDKILKQSNTICKYSSVTNGIYNPEFLYKVIDKIISAVGLNALDLNFSYDLKYRFKSELDRKQVLKNINEVHRKYNYKVGVQMILTQYILNLWKNNEFNINDFINENFPGNSFCFLYPHKINTGKILNDFNFNRNDFILFVKYIRDVNFNVYKSFIQSTKNSALFKYSGCYHYLETKNSKEQPILSDGKDIKNKCGHSILYQCYNDCDKCMMCDLYALDSDCLI